MSDGPVGGARPNGAGGPVWHDVRWSDDAAAYAVGALDGAEQAAYEAHLAECGACRSDVRAYRELVPGLAANLVPPGGAATPPPALRARIVNAARADAARQPEAAPGPPNMVLVPADQLRTPVAGLRRPPTQAPRRWPAALPWLTAAAAAVAAAVLGAGWANERELRLSERQQSVRALQRLAADVTRRTASIDSSLDATRDSVFAQNVAPDVRAARLTPTAIGPRGSAGWLLVDAGHGTAVLAATALPLPQPGRIYQAWALRPGAPPASLGFLLPDEKGRVRVTMRMPDPRAVQVIAITEEPDGGSPQPTVPPMMSGEVGGV